MLKDFEKKYDVDIRLSTFNDADEALTKIASGNLGFDLYFPSYDSLGRLVQADLLRPLNHDYLTNTRQPVGRASATPGTTWARSTPCPYTIYSTGIGWRTDLVPEDIGDARQPVRRLLGHAVRRQHGDPRRLAHGDGHGAAAQRQLDINSTDAGDIAMVREQLLELRDTMDPQVTIAMYTDLPAGSTA